jgi:hypothetical protein
MKAYGGVDVQIKIVFISAPLEMSGEVHASASLSPVKNPLYPLYRRLGGPRAGLDDVEKIIDPSETQTPASRSSSL